MKVVASSSSTMVQSTISSEQDEKGHIEVRALPAKILGGGVGPHFYCFPMGRGCSPNSFLVVGGMCAYMAYTFTL